MEAPKKTSMTKIRHTETLVYYDGPQAWLGVTEEGLFYVCTNIDDETHFCVQIDQEIVMVFNNDNVWDKLYDLYKNPVVKAWYTVKLPKHSLDISGDFDLVPIEIQDIPEDWFCEKAYKLNYSKH